MKSGMPKKPSNTLRLEKTYDLKIPQSIIIKECFATSFLPRNLFHKHKMKINRWISQNLLIICLKCISEERVLFNGNANIINVSLKFLIKVPTQKAKSLQKSDIPKQFWKLLKSALWYYVNIQLLKFFSTMFYFLHFFLFTWNIFSCLVFLLSYIWLNI